MTDVALLIAILAVATSFGLWRRRTDGRMIDHVTTGSVGADRAPADRLPADPGPADRAPADRLPADPGPADRAPAVPAGRADALTEADLGARLGERATLVQFSSSFCQPCRATRGVLSEVAGWVPGVAHVELDAESNLPLVRRFNITRTPTVLILDDAGRIHRRATGAPRKADVVAALGELA